MKQINSVSDFKNLSIKIKQVEYNNIIYTRHKNPDGSIGGFVAKTAKVETSVYIGINARVSGNARVYGNAWVSGNARVYGNARVSGNAWVSGDKIITILKTVQVFEYCISITPNYVFCGCEKWAHKEIKTLQYEKCRAKNYMTKVQFEILKKMILLAIKY